MTTEGHPEIARLIDKGQDWARILRKAAAENERNGIVEVMPCILTTVAETLEALLAVLITEGQQGQVQETKEDQARGRTGRQLDATGSTAQ